MDSDTPRRRRGLYEIGRNNMEGSNGGQKRAPVMRRRPSAGSVHTHSESIDRKKFIRKKSIHRKRIFFRFTFLFSCVLLVVLLLLGTIFSSTTLVVSVREESFSISGTFTAVRHPLQSGDISYLLKGPLVAEAERTISATRKTRQTTKSSGEIKIYNTHASGQPLDLINRSRFVLKEELDELDPSGKGDCSKIRCWRLKGLQDIPGGRVRGGEFIPGYKVATIVADKPGDDYNITKIGTRFIIPGLQKYESFSGAYAESTTNIVGGFEGIVFVPESEDLEKAEEEIQVEIKKSLLSELSLSIEKLEGISSEVLFDDGVFIKYRESVQKQGDEEITLSKKGALRAVVFKESSLADLIYSSLGSAYSKKPSMVRDAAFEFEITDRKFMEESNEDGAFDFTLTGDGLLRWGADRVLLFDYINGVDKKDVSGIINDVYPGVSVEKVSVFPFWKGKVTNSVHKFNLVVEESE